jgi:hypothetical protein
MYWSVFSAGCVNIGVLSSFAVVAKDARCVVAEIAFRVLAL